MELRRPLLEDQEAILEMMAEFEAYQSAHDGGFWHREHFNYEDWLERNYQLEIGFNLKDGLVPSIQFVGFDEDNLPLGFLSLRLTLNQNLLERDGHIGYSVRPTL